MDHLEAAEEEFVQPDVWRELVKAKLPEELRNKGVVPTPEMFGLTEVTETFRGKEMKGVNVLTGKAGHFKRRKVDSTGVKKRKELNSGLDDLEEGQGETIFAAARSSIVAKHTDVAKALQDAVYCCASFQH